MRKILIYCFIVACSFYSNIFAQGITVTARIDSTSMWIGSQTRLSFEVSQKPGSKVTMPLFSDTIVGGIEIVEPLKLDTVKSPDGQLLVTQSYVVTSFEDSLLYIPAYPFVDGKDTVWSKSLSLKVVQPFVIDTAANQITDIKGILNPKINWKYYFVIMLIAGLIVAFLVLAFFVIRRLIKKKPVFAASAPEPTLPAYVIALSKLDSIKQNKNWQQGRSKQYHTELTDVIREYIERTFEIPCMEMTSEEIISQLNHLRFESKTAYTCLQQILKLADLVKFAKWEAAPDEHELSLYNAYLFVNETKIEEQKNTEELNEQNESDK